MRPPHRDRYEDDPDGYEAAWQSYECAMDTDRDRQRDEAAEREIESKATNHTDTAP